MSKKRKIRAQKTRSELRTLTPKRLREAMAQTRDGARALRKYGAPENGAVAKNGMDPRASLIASGRNVRARTWQPIFLESLRAIPNVTIASKAAGIARVTAIMAKARDPKFAELWDQAIEQGIDGLEAACWKRATIGFKNPIYGRDERGRPVKVGETTQFSDRLAEVLLRAHRPTKYREKIQQEISGPNGQPIGPLVAPTQVVIQIPDNGRGNQDPEPKQITDIPPQDPAPGSSNAS